MVYMGTASFLLNVEVSCGLYGHSLIPFKCRGQLWSRHSLIPFKCRGQLWSIWAQPQNVEVSCGLYGHSLIPFKCRVSVVVYMGTASFLLNVEVSCGLYGHSLIPFKCRGQLWSIWAQPHSF